jgi:hypothetical protein
MLSRRDLFRRSGGVTVVAAGVLPFLDGAAEAAPQGSSHVARVLRQEGEQVTVELLDANRKVTRTARLPMLGFPPGWALRRGDLVIATGDRFPVDPDRVIPLFARLRGSVTRTGRSAVRVGGSQAVVRPQTMNLKAQNREQRGAYCIKNDLDETLSCVALRS